MVICRDSGFASCGDSFVEDLVNSFFTIKLNGIENFTGFVTVSDYFVPRNIRFDEIMREEHDSKVLVVDHPSCVVIGSIEMFGKS
jgi:hypothetical protein